MQFKFHLTDISLFLIQFYNLIHQFFGFAYLFGVGSQVARSLNCNGFFHQPFVLFFQLFGGVLLEQSEHSYVVFTRNGENGRWLRKMLFGARPQVRGEVLGLG